MKANKMESTTTDANDVAIMEFGCCPKCGYAGIVNVGRSHYGVCLEHELFWPIGSNLFSCWRDEPEFLHELCAALLKHFHQVKPSYEWREAASCSNSATVIDFPNER